MDTIVSVGANLYRGYDVTTVFESLSRLGVKYVDLDFIKPPATFTGSGYLAHVSEEDLPRTGEFRRKLSDHGLKAVTFSGHMYLNTPQETELFLKKMRFASEIGASVISTNQGPRAKADDFYRQMESIVAEAEKLNITVGLETAMPRDVVEKGTDAKGVTERIGSPHVGITYDTGNIFYSQRGEIDYLEDFAACLPYLSNLHFKDACLEDGELRYCAVGTGKVDFAGICRLMREKDINLPVTIEIPYFFRSRNWSKIETLEEKLPVEGVEEIIRTSMSFITEHLG